MITDVQAGNSNLFLQKGRPCEKKTEKRRKEHGSNWRLMLCCMYDRSLWPGRYQGRWRKWEHVSEKFGDARGPGALTLTNEYGKIVV